MEDYANNNKENVIAPLCIVRLYLQATETTNAELKA